MSIQYQLNTSGLPVPDISVLIPTWNNLRFLQCCIDSILRHSFHRIQIIVIINEGIDGTKEWVASQPNLDYVLSSENLGICYGLNAARQLVRAELIAYANDDMVMLPGWDSQLLKAIRSIGHSRFMVSSTMIEPVDSANPCVRVADFGGDPDHLDEAALIERLNDLHKKDWCGSTWPPNVVHRDTWDLVGGMSIEFSPGMYSDPDLSMKLYKAGVRHFQGVGSSLVYHFGRRSTGRVRKNRGRHTFLNKWGITSRIFMQHILHIGQEFHILPADQPLDLWTRILCKLKRIRSAMR
ncbi:MAG: glycosyltransferase [Saprospiraceae bacterium]|nr:glycosyltransferase [Saprospiraceae bacterium]HMX89236.1 glycosyltransferase [Saprospiraceae bacterium]HMZ40295.1 glycosyltransferase [Saprospiraceae bacterium]HNA63351.1 glycosyltransferase [Saprospiraceae bacterium]HNB29741.1 glycosyltransferase [Saprospiraceae bacterium]